MDAERCSYAAENDRGAGRMPLFVSALSQRLICCLVFHKKCTHRPILNRRSTIYHPGYLELSHSQSIEVFAVIQHKNQSHEFKFLRTLMSRCSSVFGFTRESTTHRSHIPTRVFSTNVLQQPLKGLWASKHIISLSSPEGKSFEIDVVSLAWDALFEQEFATIESPR